MSFFFLLQLDTILLNIYEYMQKFAVGLEQIVWDQEYYNGRFQEEFKQTELNLGAVSVLIYINFECNFFFQERFTKQKRGTTFTIEY